jgi:hypothetical protein
MSGTSPTYHFLTTIVWRSSDKIVLLLVIIFVEDKPQLLLLWVLPPCTMKEFAFLGVVIYRRTLSLE